MLMWCTTSLKKGLKLDKAAHISSRVVDAENCDDFVLLYVLRSQDFEFSNKNGQVVLEVTR